MRVKIGKTFNAAYKSNFLVHCGFTALDAPKTFRCDECFAVIEKGSTYYHRTLSSSSGTDDVNVCFGCATTL